MRGGRSCDQRDRVRRSGASEVREMNERWFTVSRSPHMRYLFFFFLNDPPPPEISPLPLPDALPISLPAPTAARSVSPSLSSEASIRNKTRYKPLRLSSTRQTSGPGKMSLPEGGK